MTVKKTVFTTEQYANARGITQRAVQKSIRHYKESPEFSSKALPGVEQINYFGKIAQLIMMDNYGAIIRKFNRKKEKTDIKSK